MNHSLLEATPQNALSWRLGMPAASPDKTCSTGYSSIMVTPFLVLCQCTRVRVIVEKLVLGLLWGVNVRVTGRGGDSLRAMGRKGLG